MKEGTCECTDSWHGHKEPSIRPTRDGENNLTQQLHFGKKVKNQFNSGYVTMRNDVQLKMIQKKKKRLVFIIALLSDH